MGDVTCLICLIFDISWRFFVLEDSEEGRKKEEGRWEICDSRIEKGVWIDDRDRCKHRSRSRYRSRRRLLLEHR